MSKKRSLTPWHEVVSLRDDLKSGELSLAVFAADLYDVLLQKGQRKVYEDPAEFFALTYPTLNLRELVRDVVDAPGGPQRTRPIASCRSPMAAARRIH